MLLDDYLDNLNRQMCDVLRGRFDDDNYYMERLSQNAILSTLERRVVKYVSGTFAPRDHYLEICGGIGQLSFALNSLGYPCDFVEISESRKLLGEQMVKALLSKYPIINGCIVRRWQTMGCEFASTVICTNAVNSQCDWSQDLPRLQRLLDCGKHLIMQPNLYGTVWQAGQEAVRTLQSPREHWIVPDQVVHWWPNELSNN